MDEKMMRVGIEADGKVFKDSLKGVETAAEQAANKLAREFSEKASSGVDRLEARMKGMQQFMVRAFSIAAIKDIGGAFLEQDRALTTLAESYNSVGIYSGRLMRESEALATEMQRVANAGDEAVASGMGLMTVIGKLSEDQIPAATRAAVGISKVLGIELNEAFKLVGKAAAGKTETLGRYGIVVDATGTKQEKFNQVLSEGAKMFDIAKGKAGDATGRYESLGLAIGDLKEAGGALAGSDLGLTAIEAVTYGVQNLTDYLNNLPLVAEIVSVKMTKFFRNMGQMLPSASMGMGMSPGASGYVYKPKGVDLSDEALDKKLREKIEVLEKKLENSYRKPTGTINTNLAGEDGGGIGGVKFTKSKPSTELVNDISFRQWVRAMQAMEEPRDRTADARKMQEELDKMMVGPELPDWRREEIDRQKQLDEGAIEAWKYMDEIMDESAERQQRRYEDMANRNLDLATGWADTMYGMMEVSDYSFGRIADNFGKMIEGMMIRGALAGVFNLMTGGTGGFMGGFKTSFPGRASGGPVEPGVPYWVGERGPELRVFNRSGSIVPAAKVAGNTTTINDHSTVIIQIPKGERADTMTVRRFGELYRAAKRGDHL
jgi:hypothetical protein